jgi:hypothetical protein
MEWNWLTLDKAASALDEGLAEATNKPRDRPSVRSFHSGQ